MKNDYDFLFITSLSAFYKVKLYNEISRKKRVYVIFLDYLNNRRNKDFVTEKKDFESITLSDKVFWKKYVCILKILFKIRYKKIVLGGWDSIYYWMIIPFIRKNKSCIVVESSIYESKIFGIRKILKQIYINKFGIAFVSGESQKRLLHAISYRGRIIKTYGVGIFNIISRLPFTYKDKVEYFLYVGRLSEEKNLQYLIETFNSLPSLQLTIIGFRPQEIYLKKIAKSNIKFLGPIANKDMSLYYQMHDVFILPSVIEPWGMVVEEAFNNGLPVIVSDKVGCSDEIVKSNINGLIFDIDDANGLRYAIIKMLDLDFYNLMRKNVCNMNFDLIKDKQVQAYCNV